ncbi:hypothetical protein M9H77_13398 [Catharanthus roseus]|uniref:Uncharacterized protein n=1 Tax=Catharanthus roseus TaxID=4058 RepID=A0ACC0BK89_CATRO|nr:hypothetical protein M9H77_13398 [Catharanthus roseus]
MRGANATGKLSKSRHISVTSTPEFERSCNAKDELHGQSPEPSIPTKHLTSAHFHSHCTLHSHKTRLQILGTYQHGAMSDVTPIGPNPPRYYTPSLKWIHPPESVNCPRYWKRP